MRFLQSILVLLLAAPSLILAQQKSPIVLERANSLQSKEENGIRSQELTGNVKITRDSLSVTCENATYYPDSGIVIFRNRVEFHDPKRTLLADEVIYNEFTEQVHASNHVRVYQGDSLSASSRTADYQDRLEHGFLHDDVHIREDQRRVHLTGKLGYLDHVRDYGWVTGDPVLIERDSLQRIATEIHGDTVSYDNARKLAQAVGKVTVERDSLVSHGQKLQYFTQDKFAELTGAPHAKHGMDEMAGDTIRLYFHGEKLERVEVWGHAVATSPADSGFKEPMNRMEGQNMTLWLDSTAVKEILVEGSAIATYYIREKGQPKGMNITSGDRLRVFFEDRKIARIRVEGGTQGDYTPQRLVSRTS